MEPAGLNAERAMAKHGRHDFVRDMGRIFEMMTQRSLRQFRGRCAVWVRDRTESWVSYGRHIKSERRFFRHRMRVAQRKLHEQVVGMLSVDNRRSKSRFTRLEQ